MRGEGLAQSSRQRGQSLALFALFLMFAFIGFLALTTDLGFLFGQRRYDQNGSDAAVLAAAQYLASNVAAADPTGNTVYFSVSDAEVYSKVEQYAGLVKDANNQYENQNNGLAGSGRTRLNASLEYAADGVTWCYSPSGAADPSIPACTLFNVGGVNYPPQPTNNPYKVRVIVRSATDSYFAQVIGNANLGQSSGNCQPPPSSNGMLTCAKAVAVITGSLTNQGSGPVIPVASANCNVGTMGQLYELWGSSGTLTCPDGTTFNYGSWASIVDLTSESTWCDDPSAGSSTNPDYKYHGLLPIASQVASGTCQTLSPDTTWIRTGYSPDPNYPNASYPFGGIVSNDLQWWIAKGFQGTLQVGDMFPTYLDANPSQSGNQGQNIAAGFYCGSSGVTSTSCSTTINIAGTYFFAQNQPGYNDVCPDDYGAAYGLGCRDANVLLWANPQVPQGAVSSANTWTSAKNSPDRVQIPRILNFRIYCQHAGTICNNPPKVIVGNAANSSVWGRFVAPFVPPPATCSTCGPNLNGNSAGLSE